MNIQTMSKKLRHAADALDALLEVEPTRKIARAIAASLPGPTRVHWMKRPENAARVARWRKKMTRAAHARKAAL